MKFISFIFAVLFLVSCKTTTTPTPAPITDPPPLVSPVPVEESIARIELSWEVKAERVAWSEQIISNFKKDFDVFSSATDVLEICPKFKSLTKDHQLKAFGEFWVAVAYHESAYKPTQESVDVGSKNDKGSWSVGLYQMSSNDNSAKDLGVSYEMLKNPIHNINVAMLQLKKQVSKRGKFYLQNSDSMRYWAVILKGNRYSQISDINSRVLKNAPFCK